MGDETSSSLRGLRTNDSGVSPVIGTILMVAVTVALGATVLAIMSGVGNKGVQESTNAVFKATAIDTDGNGKTDQIKLTYISGPATLQNADVNVHVANTAGTLMGTSSTATTWAPGDFRIYDVASGSSAGSWLTTVSVLKTTVVDTSITVDE